MRLEASGIALCEVSMRNPGLDDVSFDIGSDKKI
jgi:hypothetical protein